MPSEAIRYLHNAKQILKQVPIENDIYLDRKPVREAFGTAYLAILEAIDEYLVNRKGFHEKDLPKSTDAYRHLLRKYASVHNGKLLKEFEALYRTLHIAGHYRGLLENRNVVKESLKNAQTFIEKLAKT